MARSARHPFPTFGVVLSGKSSTKNSQKTSDRTFPKKNLIASNLILHECKQICLWHIHSIALYGIYYFYTTNLQSRFSLPPWIIWSILLCRSCKSKIPIWRNQLDQQFIIMNNPLRSTLTLPTKTLFFRAFLIILK